MQAHSGSGVLRGASRDKVSVRQYGENPSCDVPALAHPRKRVEPAARLATIGPRGGRGMADFIEIPPWAMPDASGSAAPATPRAHTASPARPATPAAVAGPQPPTAPVGASWKISYD